MATLESLQAKIRKLEQQAEALIEKESSGAIEKIRGLMKKHGLTSADIDAHSGGAQRAKTASAKTAAKSVKSVAKFRDPRSGATWSGHGRAPGWIANAKNRDKFLVIESAAAVEPTPAKNAKTEGAYARGPQPALYRDDQSGATWSGRGRAPAWLASVKDRTKFLIDGTVAASATSAQKLVADKSTEKRIVVKKAFAKKAVTRKTAG